ncbi:MAG: hypothetical protein GY834_04470 [Bacteroidetes bacterium]|nr:hypothetical protein [Bacteroidota bacterium]
MLNQVCLVCFLVLLLPFTSAAKNEPEVLYGIDVSWHNGPVDWKKVKDQKYSFAVVKSTEGIDLQDKTFKSHWPMLKKFGFIRGAYHFYVTEDDPIEQAKFFITSTPLQPGDLAPIVDIEVIGAHTKRSLLYPKLKKFLLTLEKHYKIKPIIYSTPNFWDKHFHKHLKGYALWVAQYGVKKPRLPVGWDFWHIWQYTNNATIKGIGKTVDLSRFNTSKEVIDNVTIPKKGPDTLN